MTPIRNPTSQPEQRFNNALSTTRMPVECMFGMWKRRFACLTQKLRTKLTTSLTIIVACAVLHNIAIGHSDLEDDTPILNEEIIKRPTDSPFGGAVRRTIILQYFTRK